MKRQDIELVRIISAFAIIWYHAQAPGRPIAYGGLIVFISLSMYLAGEKVFSSANVLRRAQRTLVPWAVWFAIYALVNVLLLQRPAMPMYGGVIGTIAGVLSGPRIHLWYMPFIFGSLVALDLARLVVSRRVLMWVSAAAYIAILATAAWWRPPTLAVYAPITQYAHAAAGVFLGIFLARSDMLADTLKWLVAVAMAVATAVAWPFDDVAVPYFVGLVVSYPLTTPWTQRFKVDVTTLSACALGIYFIHPLFLTLLENSLPRGTYSLAIATIILSTMTVFLARRAVPRFAQYWS